MLWSEDREPEDFRGTPSAEQRVREVAEADAGYYSVPNSPTPGPDTCPRAYIPLHNLIQEGRDFFLARVREMEERLLAWADPQDAGHAGVIRSVMEEADADERERKEDLAHEQAWYADQISNLKGMIM